MSFTDVGECLIIVVLRITSRGTGWSSLPGRTNVVPAFRNVLAKSVFGLAVACAGPLAMGQLPEPPAPDGGLAIENPPLLPPAPAASEAVRKKVNDLVEEVPE